MPKQVNGKNNSLVKWLSGKIILLNDVVKLCMQYKWEHTFTPVILLKYW